MSSITDEVSRRRRPVASISLDLDNKWSYLKTHGDSGWVSFPSYLDLVIPPVLDLFDELDLKITFFIVGQDAALERNHRALALLTAHGHEVGNHSFHHEPWLHLYSREELVAEIIAAEEQIKRVTSQRPVGFRGPGFSWNRELLEILQERDYLYDATTFPTYIGPLARAYYFWRSSLSSDEKKNREKLFGDMREGMRPVKPYRWQLGGGKSLLEIPVTTIPLLKVPFHMSYLLYLSRFSNMLMRLYLQFAVSLCGLTGTGPSFLLHPLDFLDLNQVPELAFFPGMNLDKKQKINHFKNVIAKFRNSFELVDMSTHARALATQNNLKLFSPS